jgi:uncharacterized protein
MANYDPRTARYGASVAGTVDAIDEGLRSHMLRVYNYMMIGLVVTGIFALGTFNLAVAGSQQEAVVMLQNGVMLTQLGATIYLGPLMWVIALAPLGMVILLSSRLHKMSVGGAQMTFWVFAALMGLSLSSIFVVYTASSITQVFFIAAATFGTMSLFGYTTKRDLSGMGSFLMMGVFGLIIAMVVNMFLGSSALEFAISVIGVLVFTALTAYDTQKIKEMYYVGDDGSVAGRKAIMGALNLYLDLILLFQFLLSLLGSRE